MSTQPIYKVIFMNQGKVFEIYARSVGHGSLFGFVEVEELIYRHESVVDAAVVALPDERLGERGCAFVQLKQGTSLTLDELVSFLLARKLTKPYLPERLALVSEIPRTPSGKIQKFKLREQATKMSA